jgi:hypothetical protein
MEFRMTLEDYLNYRLKITTKTKKVWESCKSENHYKCFFNYLYLVCNDLSYKLNRTILKDFKTELELNNANSDFLTYFLTKLKTKINIMNNIKYLFVCKIDLPQELIEVKLQQVWLDFLKTTRNESKYPENIFDFLEIRTGLNDAEKEALNNPNNQEDLWGYEKKVTEDTVIIESYEDRMPPLFLQVIETIFEAELWELGW